jgi:oligoribonuclease NrnB/cAMP/cGMP phosphodiesterase (DHH superfamily)
MNHVIFYHSNCLDGAGAAFAAWLALRDRNAQYIPVQPDTTLNGEQLQLCMGSSVYVLDTCLNEASISALEPMVYSLHVLDHHRTFQERWGSYCLKCEGGFHFNLHASGASMAWKHFHPDRDVPWFIQWIEAGDRWEWDRYPQARAFLHVLYQSVANWRSWTTWFNVREDDRAVRQIVAVGESMLEGARLYCERMVDHAQRCSVAGVDGLMVNDSSEHKSMLGNALALKSGTYGLIWRVGLNDQGEPRVFLSFRSVDPFDVKDVAGYFGGGGHPQASGGSVTLDQWWAFYKEQR